MNMTAIAAMLTAVWPGFGRAVLDDAPLEAADHGRHRVQREHPLPLLWQGADRVDDAGEVEPDLDEERDRVRDVAVPDVDGGQEETDPERSQARP